ncbi:MULTISPECIES: class I SAM-dependent methyltransferase [unclassified Vibrio]|uniref:class I SAM-dependent methyltransferase n=1 Tax=unclassified Vibrio TaxID=2614977 RepID=UPI001F3292DE|nr:MULTISPECIES: class I SAM-dependent methyltransferase [unclassified Vibrio]QXL80199.1 Ubiquinone/menaquinone biosynthesis C-methyltransferase UbiE [Vibrio sp.]
MFESRNNEVRELYKDVDCYSDAMESEIHTEIYTLGLESLFSSLQNVNGAVIDASCGSGHFLKKFSEQYNQEVTLIGVDLSPLMIQKSKNLLQDSATLYVGDMTNLSMIEEKSCAALVSYFSIQHLTHESLLSTFVEWKRVLVEQGTVILAGWEGCGTIDYGEKERHLAYRYSVDTLKNALAMAGFRVDTSGVIPVRSPGEPMDAFYLQATNC